jgi:predicted permease
MEKHDMFEGRKGLNYCQIFMAAFIVLTQSLFVLILIYEYQPEKTFRFPFNDGLV